MADKYVYIPTQKSNTIKDLKISTLLPSYIQTTANRNFFEATVETLFSVDKVESVSGYIGEKPDRVFNAETDFYIPEVTKERTDYQFTPMVATIDSDGNIDSKYFYSDLVNNLRHQGANVESHERLFRQEYYSFSPLIDINKFINYSQYYWMQKGPKTVDFSLIVNSINYGTKTFDYQDVVLETGNTVMLSGILPSGLSVDTVYYVISVDSNTFALAASAIDATNDIRINFSFVPDASVTVNMETNFDQIIGLKSASIYGIALKNGMIIRTYHDVLDSYNGFRWIVEGVGESIQILLLDEIMGYDSSPYDTQPYDYDEISYVGDPNNIDYVTISRGSTDGNPWSMRNRWFHISVLNEQELSANMQAKRPIVEFIPNIQLYNFGSNYKGKVDVVYTLGNIQDITGKTSATIDGTTVTDGMRILVINDVDETRNNTVYEVFGLHDGSLSLTNIGTASNGDTYFVNYGTVHANSNVYMKNNVWAIGQKRTSATQDIMFQLYDDSGIALDDEAMYPDSSFSGSKVFGYKINETYPIDRYLNRHVQTNEFNQLMFDNYLDMQVYSYVRDFVPTNIIGNYFMSVNGEFKNHWHKSDLMVNQAIVDEFVIYPTVNSDGTEEYQQIYKLSQAPAVSSSVPTLIVKLNGVVLQNGVDYENTDADGYVTLNPAQYIKLSLDILNSLSSGDLLKIYTYNSDTPTQPISGYYEVPTLVGLVGNSLNREVESFGRNDIIEHFVSILERQNDFVGDPLGYNISPNIKINYGRGIHVVQNTASLINLMGISSYENMDIMDSMRYVDNEYKRFQNQWRNKIEEFYRIGYTDNTSYVEWIDNSIDEINLGKSSDFPFEFSGMASRKFVPPSASYLGLSPMYKPYMFYDTTLLTPRYMIRCHDGRLIPSYTESLGTGQTIVGNGSTKVFVLNESVVFPWEIIVTSSYGEYIPYSDYTVFGGNTIVFNEPITGDVTINPIPNVLDKVVLFFEYEVYNSSSQNFKTGIREFDLLQLKPGYFRHTDYSLEEYNEILERIFNRWASYKGYNSLVNDTYDEDNDRTWNYSSVMLSDGTYLPGSWRGIFQYFYDTDRPNTAPWEMLGFYEKPDWWTANYGAAPFTSSNILLWDDIKNGHIREGDRQGTYNHLKREHIYTYMPVDEDGAIKSVSEIFGTYDPNIVSRKADWKFGDVSPVEYEWMRSSHYNYALAMVQYLINPNRFVDLLWEPENNLRIFKDQLDSQLVSGLTHERFRNQDLKIFNTIDNNGSRVFRFGFQQIIVEYLKSQGRTPEELAYVIHNSYTRMGYRVGGFMENSTSRFVADNFGLVPHENFHVSLHQSASLKELSYSGVIITKMEEGYKISGYDLTNRKFPIKLPETNGGSSSVSVGGKSPSIVEWTANVRYNVGIYVRNNFVVYRCIVDHRASSTFENDRNNWIAVSEVPLFGGISVRKYDNNPFYTEIPYDTIVYDAQDIFNIIYGYQLYLEENGFIFEDVDNSGNQIDFEWVARKIFEWILKTPTVGNTLFLSPLGDKVTVDLPHGFIEKLTTDVNGSWPIVSANGKSIKSAQFEISRDNGQFSILINTESTEERIFNAVLSVREIEHVVIFDNVTNFHDIIYNDLFGIRQRRLKAYMNRSGDWVGTMSASGFIIKNDTIVSNMEKNTNDFRNFYDSEEIVVGGDFNKAAKKLVGYQTRNYLNNLLFDDNSAFQFYQGFLKDKGTIRAVDKLMRNSFVQSITNIDVNEEWAIKLGSYGGLDAYSSLDIQLLPEDIKSNPQMVKFLASGEDDPRNSIIEINPNDDRYVYKRPINMTEDQFKVDYVSPIMPYAGYLSLFEADFKVPFMDTMSQYFLEQYGNSAITEYQRLWLAENGKTEWSFYRIINSGQVVNTVTTVNKVVTLGVPDSNAFTVGDLIIVDADTIRTVLKVTAIDTGLLTVSTLNGVSLPNMEVDGQPSIFKLENIRFSNVSEFVNYSPEKAWVSTDIVAIDSNQDGIWEIRNALTNTVNRVQEKQVSLENFVSARLYDTNKSINLYDMELYHPLHNVLPFAVRQNLDYVLNYDPAKYNSSDPETMEIWTKEKTGSMWWDLSTCRFIEYDQLDDLYKLNHWGNLFPGTSVDVYQWVRSPLHPAKWKDYLNTSEGFDKFSQGSYPYSTTDFVINVEYNIPLGKYINYYYFWVKGNNFRSLDCVVDKTLSTVDLVSQIINPTMAGIHWITPLSSDSFAFANISQFLGDYTNLRLSFTNKDNENVIHSEWNLLSENNDDRNPPQITLDKIKDSIIGYVQIIDTVNSLYSQGFSQPLIDEYGTVLDDGRIDLKLPVPDPKIMSMSLYGNNFRPRQSWYIDIVAARKNYIHSVNRQLSLKNWVDTTNDWETYLYASDPEPNAAYYDHKVLSLFERDALIGTVGFIAGQRVLVENDITLDGKWSLWNYNGTGFTLSERQGFRVADYWNFVDYYAAGYSTDTFINKTYPTIFERNSDFENQPVGSIIKVSDDGYGNFIVSKIVDMGGTKVLELIGKQNGTFKFSDDICTCEFGNESLSVLYDGFITALSEIKDRNTMISDMIKEVFRQHHFVDWVFKTSLVDIVGMEEQLTESPIIKPDLSENILAYFNELKPYHVKVRGTIDRRYSYTDDLKINWSDEHTIEETILIDRVSCVPDMSLPVGQWKAAERISSFGGNPAEVIPGCQFRGTEIDGKYFNFFNNVIGAGFDVNPYDSTVLGYDFSTTDIQQLYDVIVNGKDFTSLPDEISDTIVDGGSFYQPLLSANRPPELIKFHMGDTLSLDVYTLPYNINIKFGYDAQEYDNEVTEENKVAGYDYNSANPFSLVLRPKMIQDLYLGDGQRTSFPLSQIPQSNESVFVYVNEELLDDTAYTIEWNGFKPKVILNAAPDDLDKVKILSYSIGGAANALVEFYKKAVTSDTFDVGIKIETPMKVTALVNGVDTPAQWLANGNTGLTDSQVRIPAVASGSTVFIVVYEGDGAAKVFNTKYIYNNQPFLIVDSSAPTGIKELADIVYMNGSRLAPSYSRYFDPIVPVDQLFSNEYIRDKRFVDVYVNDVVIDPSQYEVDIFRKEIKLGSSISAGSETVLLNNNNSAYHYEGNELYIHTVAVGNTSVDYIPDGSRIVVNGTVVDFNRPDTGNIPLDINVGFNVIKSSGFVDVTTPLGQSLDVQLNGVNLVISANDSPTDISSKINAIQDLTAVVSYIDGNSIVMRSDGYNIDLIGNWLSINFISGVYRNAVSFIQESMGIDFRVLTLDGDMCVIDRTGADLSFQSNGSVDLVSQFGFNNMYSNTGNYITVVSMDDNSTAGMRTEVYEGNVVGEYPVTRQGFSNYSSNISVIGNDQTVFSDFKFESLEFGFDLYGYDDTAYDYVEKPGIMFNEPHSQKETVVVTTYSGTPKDIRKGFKIFKNLRHEYSYYHLADEYNTVLSANLGQTDVEIVVEDATVLPTPSPENNLPGYVWIDGEIIGYFEVDMTVAGHHKLKKLIRGSKGTPMGVTNFVDGNGNKYMNTGTVVKNLSDHMFQQKDVTNVMFV